MSKELSDIFADAGVTRAVADWLLGKGIRRIEAFADLAESRQQIVEVVGRPVGLDPDDAFQCQPLRTAWRNAEAAVKASLGAAARGEESIETYAFTPEKRQRVDGAVEKAFGFRWPANLCPDDSLLGKLERFYHKKYKYTPKIQETRNVLERGRR